MKKAQWIIAGSVLLLLLWMAPFGLFDFMDNERKNLERNTPKGTEQQPKQGNIIRPIVQTTLFLFKKEQRAALWITDKQQQKHSIISEKISLKNNQNGTRLYDRESIIPEGIYTIETINEGDFSFTINSQMTLIKQNSKQITALF